MPLDATQGGGRRKGASVKTLKKILKKAGLKTSGKKAALTRRAKKAHLKLRGGVVGPDGNEIVEEKMGGRRRRGGVINPETGVDDGVAEGGRRRSRKSRGFRLY
jgi:hypothetical protein